VSKAALVGIFLGAFTPAFSQTPVAPATTATAAKTFATITPRRVAPESAYARVYCIVPIIGSGTPADPKRPMFAPARPPLRRH
jgi:hypothetical protein